MIENIQGLRAFAALNVVLFHIISTSMSYEQGVQLFAVLEGWGKNGVDIFFVISGFVMVYTQSRKPKTAALFFKNRVFRILPIYWILTAALVAMLFVMPSAFRGLEFSSTHLFSSLFFISGIVMDEHPMLSVGWTLEYEMLFYTLFALSLLAKDSRISTAIPIGALLVLAISGVTDLIVLEFVMGMICAKLYMQDKFLPCAPYMFGFGLLMLSASIILKPDLHRLFVYGIPSAFIVLSAAHLPQISNKTLSFLGAASYSIYLVQVFTIPAFYKFSSAFLGFLHNDALAVMALTSTAAFGGIVYIAVEKPISKALKDAKTPPKDKAET